MCYGDCHFVRSGATGSGDGSDWDNAYSDLPSTLTRGHTYFVTAGDYAQGECPGQGPTSATGCIDLMWAEKDQAICSGCDACPSMADGWAGKCANCKVTTSNPTCGHYLALVTSSHTMAACGFSTAKPYMAIDYK